MKGVCSSILAEIHTAGVMSAEGGSSTFSKPRFSSLEVPVGCVDQRNGLVLATPNPLKSDCACHCPKPTKLLLP